MKNFAFWTALIVAATLIAPHDAAAQVKGAVVDMEQAIVQSIEGKKAEAKFTGRLEELRKNVETKQKALEDSQNKLKTQDRLLDDAARAERTRDIEKQQTELNRLQEDAQRELETLRTDLMKPIAEVAEKVVNDYAKQENFTVI